jgi:hypothetical protein
MADRIRITILRDGTVKTETDAVSAPNHENADAFLATIRRLQGGTTTTETRPEGRHAHVHSHDGWEHAHDVDTTHTHDA